MKGILFKFSENLFGLPTNIPTSSDSSEGDFYCYYTNVFAGSTDKEKILTEQIKNLHKMTSLWLSQDFTVLGSYGFVLWEFKSISEISLKSISRAEEAEKTEIEGLFSCFFLIAAQGVILELAIFQYLEYLGAIVLRQAAISSTTVRDLFLYNDYRLHNILLWKTCVSTRERELFDVAQETISRTLENQERYINVKESLKLAVEGLEVKSSRKASRYVQFFLGCLALLGIQSLFIALVEYLEKTDLNWHLSSARSTVFIYLCLVVTFLAFWLYFQLKKL